jgi:hypothetical protein
VLVGTVAIRSASKGPMRRFSLLGVVGLLVFSASGCFSGSAGESGPRPPASEAHPVGGAALDITVREGVGGAPAHLWRFHVSCPRTKGDVAPTPVCEQITAPRAEFFGVSRQLHDDVPPTLPHAEPNLAICQRRARPCG